MNEQFFTSLNGYKVKDEYALHTYDSVGNMKNDTKLKEGMYVKTKGYYNANDGGDNEYYVTSAVPENSYYIKLQNNLYGLVLNKSIVVEQLGAKRNNTILGDVFETLVEAQEYFPNASDLTDTFDYLAIQTALTYFTEVHLSTGKYYVNKTITIVNEETKLIGNGYVNTAIQFNLEPSELTYIIDMNEKSRCEFKDFTLMSVYTAPTDHEGTENFLVSGIKNYNCQYNNFTNVRGYKLFHTWDLYNTWVLSFSHCRTNKTYKGIVSSGSDINDVDIRNCVFQQTHMGICLTGGRSHLIDSCDIEDNDIGIYREGKGDIEITNCYFEDIIKLANGDVPIDNILISGCSFWIGSNYNRLPAIRYAGVESTKMTVISCNFELSSNATTQSTPAIESYVNSAVNDNVRPTIINCNVVSQGSATAPIINTSYFDGILINKNKIFNTMVDKQKYVNLDNTPTLTLSQINSYYRFGGTGGGSSTLTIPDITDILKDVTEYTIAVAGNISDSNATSFTITASSDNTLYGTTSYTLGDLRGKFLKIKYVGEISSKHYWEIYTI